MFKFDVVCKASKKGESIEIGWNLQLRTAYKNYCSVDRLGKRFIGLSFRRE